MSDFNAFADFISDSFKHYCDENAELVRKNLMVVSLRDFNDEALASSFDDPTVQQEHRCSCCVNFIRKYGNVAIVDEQGIARSPIWDVTLPDQLSLYQPLVDKLRGLVEGRRVVAPAWKMGHLTPCDLTPNDYRGGFTHLHAVVPSLSLVEQHQFNANRKSLAINLAKYYNHDTLETAIAIFEGIESHHAKRAIELMRTHIGYRDELRTLQGDQQFNRRLAMSMDSYLSPLNGTSAAIILDGIIKDDVEHAINLYKQATAPTSYMRTERAASTNSVKAAEDWVRENNITLDRRAATQDEVMPYAIWRAPVVEKEEPKSIFGGLTNAPEKLDEGPSLSGKLDKLGWTVVCRGYDEFIDEIQNMDNLKDLHILQDLDNPCLVIGSAHDEPSHLWRWEDPEGERYPVSWAVANGYAQRRNVIRVNSVLPLPLRKVPTYEGIQGAVFTSDDAEFLERTNNRTWTLGLFAEILRGDAYDHRRVLEEYSQNNTLPMADKSETLVAGTMLTIGNPSILYFVVETDTSAKIYVVSDRERALTDAEHRNVVDGMKSLL